MSTLRLRRAAFRVAAPDGTAARGLAATIDGARPLLAGALDAVLGALPARSIVVVRRLELGLRVAGEVSPSALAAAWARGAAGALRAAWADAPAGEPRDDAPVVVFATRTEAIRAHLLRRVAGLPDAWWAASALAAGGTGGQPGAPLPDPAALLCECAREDAGAAAAILHALARHDARAFDLLDPAAAATLARLLARALPHAAPPAAAPGTGPAPDAPGAAAAGGEAIATTDPGTGPEALLAAMPGTAALARWRQLDPARRRPWDLAARLLADRAAVATRLPSARAAPAARVPPPAAATADRRAAGAVEVGAAGALLLLAPATGLFPADTRADRFRPAVLALLHRVLAPLPPAGRARALESERPLLDLLAPLPLPDAPVAAQPQDPDAAGALAALIPDAIGLAPAAPQRIPDALPPADAPAARLLLRPGRLLAEAGGAVLLWPHEAADPVLRRLGWDRDPGFVPWLGRTLRFVFGPLS